MMKVEAVCMVFQFIGQGKGESGLEYLTKLPNNNILRTSELKIPVKVLLIKKN